MVDPSRAALVIVDVQNDFCPGGALAVEQGDEVVEVLSSLAARFAEVKAPVFVTRDWHPADSRHFVSAGGPWPVHCVAGTHGAAFHPDLVVPRDALCVSKGTSPDQDGYTAFEGGVDGGPPLAEALHSRGVTHLVVGGLATDYCVKATVLDARRLGFEVTVVADAIRAVELRDGDSARAINEMLQAGARLVPSTRVVAGAPFEGNAP